MTVDVDIQPTPEDLDFEALWQAALKIGGGASSARATFKQAAFAFLDRARRLEAGLPNIGNPRFIELNAEELEVHIRKAAGYSGRDNPDTWANFREAEKWGLTPAQGCAVRLGDKYRRVQNLLRDPSNEMVGETIHDTLMDLSNYAKILICLLEEEVLEREASEEPPPVKGEWPLKDDRGVVIPAHEVFDAAAPKAFSDQPDKLKAGVGG